MAPPPTLPADVARRAEPPATPAPRSNEAGAQLSAQLSGQLTTLLTVTQRLEQAAQVNTTGLHELREELGSVRGQLRDLVAKELAPPPPLLTPPPPRAPASPVATTAAVIAAIAALGALAGAALVIREQKQQQNTLAVFANTTQLLGQTVAHLGESMASRANAPPGSERAPSAGSAGPVPDGGTRPAEPTGEAKPLVCPPAPENAAAGKSRVLLPNLVGLRLVDARAAVAPLQLQLLPTDKKLKEASKIGWQLPNPGAELESDEAVRVSLKPPVQKKKK